MKLEKEFNIGITDIGLNNSATNISILKVLEDIGCMHSDLVGLGVNDIDNTKKSWILMDWKLKIFNRPKYADKILIKTWARPSLKNSFCTYRDYEIYLNQEKIAIATSKWVLFDWNKKKITKISDEINLEYKSEEESVFEDKELEKIKEPSKILCSKQYEVKRMDIDINKHMHNLNYLSLAYEVLPEDVYFSEELKNVRIMYKHQILLGDVLNCNYTYEDDKHIITIKNKDESVLHSIIELY